jgi:methylase of polypeptide subunit release factors
MEAASGAGTQNTDNRRSGTLMHAPTHCLELGAGTGLAGLAAAQAFQVLAMLPLSLPSSREQAGQIS